MPRDYIQISFDTLLWRLWFRYAQFVVDIWRGYLRAIREVCPSAVIVADKFHIIRMVNYALDFTRRMMQRQAKRGRKKIIFRRGIYF